MIAAAKYHSYGNDFLVLENPSVPEGSLRDLSRAICDPHRGVGADGCALLWPEGEGYRLRLFNRDGSEAEMSGNGARCACADLLHRRRWKGNEIPLSTRAGLKRYRLLEERPGWWRFVSSMGKPRFRPEEIPFRCRGRQERVFDHPLRVGDQELLITALWVGNPQCVVWVEEGFDEVRFREWGARLESHPSFPQRTNVSFVQVRGRRRLRIRIWERGVGPTLSSGTGSCGAAVAALAAGKVENPVEVETETGCQLVEWRPGEEILLTGCSEFIAWVEFFWRQP